MVEMTFRAHVDAGHRRLTIDLPENLTADEYEIVVREVRSEPHVGEVLTREIIKARLRAAGLLNEIPSAPPGARTLSDEERDEIGRQFAGDRPTHELIDEDRAEY